MARVVVTLTINPESPDVNLGKLEEEAKKEITSFGGDVGKVEIEPMAFGLKAIKLIFIADEAKSNYDPLEQKVSQLPGVASARVTDVRRTIG